MLRYVVRDPQGAIISLHRDPVPGAQAVPHNDPDVLAFMATDEQRAFASLDADLVRVLEDLIDALIRRNVLNITDLPTEAQNKLFARKHFREGMQAHALSLYGAQSEHLPASGAEPDEVREASTWTQGMP
jgi:DNA-binding LacI/PurR family transcriptional regulator